jgi:hypothetical protein
LDFNNQSFKGFHNSIGISLFSGLLGVREVFLLVFDGFKGFFKRSDIVSDESEGLVKEGFDFVIDFQLNVLSGGQNSPSGEGVKVIFFNNSEGLDV